MLTLLSGCEGRAEEVELHVSAAASLQEVATELADLFMAEQPQVMIRLNFAGSNQLRQQIMEGFPVDVFLSAHLDPVQALTELGMVNQSERFAESPVVLVTATPEIASIYDLANDELTLIFAGYEVPIGIYTDIILHLVDRDDPGFREAVLGNVVSRASNVRQALLYVMLNESDATFVYATDLSEETLSEVTVIALPPHYQVVGTFYLALINQENQLDIAYEFYRFILSDTGQEVLADHGFR